MVDEEIAVDTVYVENSKAFSTCVPFHPSRHPEEVQAS